MFIRRFITAAIIMGSGVLAWLLYPIISDVFRTPTVQVSPAVRTLIENTPAPVTTSPLSGVNAEREPEKPAPKDPTPVAPATDQAVSIPATYVIKGVPFVSQAPTGNWDLPYQEACEEASVLMVNRFYNKNPLPGPEEQERIISDMTTWGDNTLFAMDTNVAQTIRFFTEYLEYDPKRVTIVYDMTIDDMKAVLASGKPIIVPASGRDLGNRYFTQPGPVYHMLVVIGYDRDEFITNDPGTKRGEGYRYSQQVLYNAVHDLPVDKDRIREGRKAMIVVSP